MPSCCVPYCNSDKRRDKSISFHEFPSNLELRIKWLINIARKDFVPNTRSACSSVVCSKHFRSDDYSPYLKKKRLKIGTVPTVFENYPSYMTSIHKKYSQQMTRRRYGIKSNGNYKVEQTVKCEPTYDAVMSETGHNTGKCEMNSNTDMCEMSSSADMCETNSNIDVCETNINTDMCETNSNTDMCEINSNTDMCETNSNTDMCETNSNTDMYETNINTDMCETNSYTDMIETSSNTVMCEPGDNTIKLESSDDIIHEKYCNKATQTKVGVSRMMRQNKTINQLRKLLLARDKEILSLKLKVKKLTNELDYYMINE